MAKRDVLASFDCTDWNVFEATAANLDELTDTMTSYIRLPFTNTRTHGSPKGLSVAVYKYILISSTEH